MNFNNYHSETTFETTIEVSDGFFITITYVSQSQWTIKNFYVHMRIRTQDFHEFRS